jgi:polyisoprenoid-binding protein YceI
MSVLAPARTPRQRRRAGQPAPAGFPLTPGAWRVVPDRTSVSFSGRVAPFAPVLRGWFPQAATGRVLVGHPRHGRVDVDVQVDVDVRRLTTGRRGWDDVLDVADPLGAERWPLASFRSAGDVAAGRRTTVDGALTLRGLDGPLRLDAALSVSGNGWHVLTVTGVVDRLDYGIVLDLPRLSSLVPRRMVLEIAATLEPVGRGRGERR